MNRRHLLSIMGSGIISGTIIKNTVNFSIAADININDLSIPENQVDNDLQFEFSKFIISTTRIETSDENPLKIELKIKNENNKKIQKHTWEFVLENQNNDKIDIEKASTKGELTPISFDSINEIINDEAKENDTIKLNFQIIIKHTNITKIIKEKSVTINVIESNIPNTEGGEIHNIEIYTLTHVFSVYLSKILLSSPTV